MHDQFAIDQQNARTEAIKEANANTYNTWLAANPKIIPCDANELMFRAYMDFEGQELTLADFDFAKGNIGQQLAWQNVPTPEQVVAAENKHRRSLSLPQLHELARKERPTATQDELPATWYGVDISTAAALKSLAKSNLQSFKALVDRFGSKVNERLGVKPATQVGTSIKMQF